MKKRVSPWISTTLSALSLGILGDVIYTLFVENWLKNHVPDFYNFGWVILAVIFLLVILIRYRKVEKDLEMLGFIKQYDQAEETTTKGLEEAKNSYWWFGTSAYYVLCDPKTRENHILTKPLTEFVFVTIDPECTSVVASESNWAHQTKEETVERISETMERIKKLKEKGINIRWEGRSTTPSFRVIVVNKEKIFVSFYEEGKIGPECKQLELDAKGLLGQWFLQYVKFSRTDETRIRIESLLTRYIIEKSGYTKPMLIETIKTLCPDCTIADIELVASDFKSQ